MPSDAHCHLMTTDLRRPLSCDASPPLQVESAGIDLQTDPSVCFLVYGGYVMLDYKFNIVSVSAITPFQSKGMMQFGPPKKLTDAGMEVLHDRWHKVRRRHWKACLL